MLCPQCGWEFNEEIDCHCSGCGRVLRGLVLLGEQKDHYTLFFDGPSPTLSLEIANPGDHTIRIDDFVVLEHLSVSIKGHISCPVVLLGKEKATVKVVFDGKVPPFSQSGQLSIRAGIHPPLDVKIVCLPSPVFFFSVNGELERNGKVRIIISSTKRPELLFKIELSRCSDVVWNSFRLYPEGAPQKTFSLPPDLSLPLSLTAGSPYEFSLIPELTPARGGMETILKADFGFENCALFPFTIEILEHARLEHTQDITLINQNACMRGKSEPREIEITLRNHGGGEAEILHVRSLDEPWLSLLSQPDHPKLQPKRKQNEKHETARFRIRVDPRCIPETPKTDEETEIVNGRLEVTIRETESNQLLSQILLIGVEMRPPRRLTHPVAVDFGNNSTCLAFPQGNAIKLVPLDEEHTHELEFPTIIDFESFTDNDLPETAEGFRYGHFLELTRYAAAEDGRSNFLHRLWSFKRCLGARCGPITRIDRKRRKAKSFSAEEIYGFFLREVMLRFERITGCTAGEVVLTYPANVSLAQAKRLSETAGAVLGKEVIAEISEPEALALYYIRRTPFERPLLFAVFDFGGGTTDISIGRVRMEEGVRIISVLISVGLDDLGGDTISFALAKDIYCKFTQNFPNAERLFPEEFGDIFRISLAEKEKLYNFMSIMNLAEDLKTNKNGRLNALFAEKEVPLPLDDFYSSTDSSPKALSIIYRLDDFNRVVASRIRKGFDKLIATFEHLREYGDGVVSSHETIDLLILGGNSSRLRIVRDLAAEMLKLSEEKILYNEKFAKTAVVHGAALYGEMREAPDTDIVFENQPHLKYPLGRKNGDHFEVLFPAGSKIGEKTIFREYNLRAPNPVLRIFWNRDPANSHMETNNNIYPAGVFSLKKFKESGNSSLKLQMDLIQSGVRITPGDKGEPEVIPIEF